MALLTKNGANKIMRHIMEVGGLSEELENDISRLQSHFEESEGFLKNFGDTYEGEELDEFEFQPHEVEPSDEYKNKYEALHKQYLDRFFGNGEVEPDETIIDTTEEKTPEPETIDSLFTNKKEE